MNMNNQAMGMAKAARMGAPARMSPKVEKLSDEACHIQAQMEGSLRQMYQLATQYAVIGQLSFVRMNLRGITSGLDRLEAIAKEVEGIRAEEEKLNAKLAGAAISEAAKNAESASQQTPN